MRRNWSRAVYAQRMPWSPWLDHLIPAAPSYIPPAPVPSQTVSPQGKAVYPGMDTPHAPGSPSCCSEGPPCTQPLQILTCRRCALLGMEAAPSRLWGRPGPVARWTCCCRCWWVWKKLTETESRSHRDALHPGTSNRSKCCLCSIPVSLPSQEHPHHRPPPAALTLLGCLVQG